jgi:hypothetical protein
MWRSERDYFEFQQSVTFWLISSFQVVIGKCKETTWDWRWGGWVGSPLIYLLQYFWIPLDVSVLVDWHHSGAIHFYTWSLCSVHMFNRWISGVTLLFAAHLASMCVSCVDGEKSPFISRLNKQLPTVVGQDQAFLL